jgi:APA family basic amino acid/polyamine antiporter
MSNILAGGKNTLSKSMKLLYVYALATGAIFTFMCYWDGIFMSYCGPAAFLAFALMAIIILPIAYIYAELSTLLPSAGSSLIYNTVGLNKHAGFWSSWLILAVWLAVPPAGTLGLIDWLNFQFGLNLSENIALLVGVLSLCGWFLLSIHRNVIAGKVQTWMLFLSIGGVILTGILFFFSSDWSLANFSNFFASGLNVPESGASGSGGWLGWTIGAFFMLSPYIGFEVVPAMVEEGTFPIHDQKKAILGSVITCGLVYAFFYFALAGMAPWEVLTGGGDCHAFISMEAIRRSFGAGWEPFVLFMGIVGVVLPITTSVLGFWVSGVRMIYAMGRQNFLPEVFARTNKHDQPILPNILILLISVSFLAMETIRSFFDLLALAGALCYIITSISSMVLARKHPEWKRPFPLPGGDLMRWTALIVSVAIAVFCSLGFTARSWFGFLGYLFIGLLLWGYMVIVRWRKTRVWIKTPDGNKEY